MSTIEYRILGFIESAGLADPAEIISAFGPSTRDFIIVLASKEMGLIRRSSRDSSKYELTPKGTIALQQQREIRRETETDRKRQTVRYWITTAIAALALVLALVSILWQAYTWRTERSELPGSRNITTATTADDYS